MSHSNELLIPETAAKATNSIEIIRVWIANGNQHFSLRVGLWEDPAAWGLLLADLARNIAKSYEEDTALEKEASLERIRLGFETELDNPTDSA